MCYQVKGKSDATVGVQLRETRLESRIAKFLSLICNVSMMKQQMTEIGLFSLLLISNTITLIAILKL